MRLAQKQERQQSQMFLPSEGSFVAGKRAVLTLLLCNSAATEPPLYTRIEPLQQSMQQLQQLQQRCNRGSSLQAHAGKRAVLKLP